MERCITIYLATVAHFLRSHSQQQQTRYDVIIHEAVAAPPELAALPFLICSIVTLPAHKGTDSYRAVEGKVRVYRDVVCWYMEWRKSKIQA